MSLRTSLRLPALRLARPFTSTPLRHTTAGYGDPQSEKIENHTPTPNPSSSSDPQPGGQGKGVGQQSGTTDPEVKPYEKAEDKPTGQKPRETKKIGEEPKKGDSPIGG